MLFSLREIKSFLKRFFHQTLLVKLFLLLILCFIRSWTQYCYSLAKKMQTSAKKACFQFAECSFSSAKIRLFLVTSKVFGKNVGMVITQKGGSRNWESPVEYCCFDDETKDYLFFDVPMTSKCRRTNTLYSFLSL